MAFSARVSSPAISTINVTPLVDVLLVLLIIFMIAAITVFGLLRVIASLVMIPLTTTLLTVAGGKGSGAKAFASSVWEAVRRPLMWAPAIGILVSLSAIKLPSVVVDSLNLLGKATPGVSLLCLGLIMSSVKMKLSFDVGENAVLKLLLQPALMVGAALMLSISGIRKLPRIAGTAGIRTKKTMTMPCMVNTLL